MRKFEELDHVKKVSYIQSIKFLKSYGTLRNSSLENSIMESFNTHVVNCTVKFEFLFLTWLVYELQQRGM